MMIIGIAHNCFKVRDLEASIRFYQGGLGMRHVFDFTREDGSRYGCYLHAGGRNFIELFAGPHEDVNDRQSYKHLCLEVDEINKTVAELRGRGVECSEPKLGGDHSWQAWITDPDGNRMELHAYTKDSMQNAGLA
jgi:catechol 2,3-dioxygenase-like lactoylglutathione lyase family enzyme